MATRASARPGGSYPREGTVSAARTARLAPRIAPNPIASGPLAVGGSLLTLPGSRLPPAQRQPLDLACVPFMAWPLLLSQSGRVCAWG